jgi:TP901 family phage tail tape measure protein
MAESLGALKINLSLEDANFTRSMQDINRKLKGLNSEFKAATAGNRGFESSLDSLRRKQDHLADTLTLHKQKVGQLKEQYEQSVATKGKDAKATENLLIRYNKALATMYKTESQLGDVTQEIAEQSNAWNKLGKKMNQAGEKLKGVGSSMKSVGQSATMSITAPIVGLGGVIAKTGADFEEGMSKVSAVSGATGETLQKLEEQAKELGATTKFSASEASEGMQYLAMAGFDANEIIASMPGLLDLAAAGALDLGRASDIASNIMSGFAIEASEAGHVSDVLAKASSSANTNVEQLGTAMQYLAPVSNSLGWSLEEATSAVMALSDAGLQGEKAGAAFSTSLTRLTSPSKEAAGVMKDLGLEFFDAEGNMKSLPSVMQEIEKGTKGLTAEQKAAALSTIFGQEAYKSWAILLEKGSGALADNTEMLEGADGAAKKMADTMSNNAKGSFKEMMSALEGLAIELSDALLPVLTDGIKVVTDLARKFSDLSPEAKKTILVVGGIAAAIPPLIMVVGGLASGIGSIISVVGMASSAIAGAGGLTAALTALTGPVGLAIAGVAALTVGGIALAKEMKKPAIEVEIFSDKVSESTQKAVGAYLKLDEQATVALNGLAWSQQTVTEEMANQLVTTFSQMNEQILTEMKADHEAQLLATQEFFGRSNTLTAEEEAKIVAKVQESQTQQQQKVTEGQARIAEILTLAKEEKRAITEAEKQEINTIQQQMKTQAVTVMSESEAEQKAILERLKTESSEITAQQAAEVVKNATKQKDDVIKKANEQYNSAIAEIIRMRDESGVISAEQADKLIEEAKRQKDEVVKKAEETHTKVVKEAKEQAKEHINAVDWETGEVLSKWDKFTNELSISWDFMKKTAKRKFDDMAGNIASATARATADGLKNLKNLKSKAATKLSEIVGDFRDFKNDIVGFFANMVLKIPTPSMPKLPHFSLKTSTKSVFGKDITYPSGINVNWYKDGGLFAPNSPQLIGVGDANVPEAAVPLNQSVMSMLAKKITDYMPQQATNSAGQPNINVYIGDQEILDLTYEYFEDKQSTARLSSYTKNGVR